MNHHSKHSKLQTMSKAQWQGKKTTATVLSVSPSLILSAVDTPQGHQLHVDFNGSNVRVLQLQRKFTYPDGTVARVTYTNDTGGTSQSGDYEMADKGILMQMGETSWDYLINDTRPFDQGVIPGTYEYFADASLIEGGFPAFSNHVILTES